MIDLLKALRLRKPETNAHDEQQFQEEMTKSERERREVEARLKALSIYVDVMDRQSQGG